MQFFLQYAKDNNKIKTIDEIEDCYFENFDVFEEEEIYNNYIIGDLVLVHRYKYKNGRMGYYHIFLIVDMYINCNKTLYYGMILSSKIEKISYSTNKLIIKDNENNLKKDSIIKTDAIYEIFTKNILLKIGKIDKTKVEIYKKCLINNL